MEIKKTKRITKLKKISISNNEDVYDITVKKNHNFIANGIVVHNCVEIGKVPYFLHEDGTKESGWQGCVSYDTKLITKDGIVKIGESVGKEIEVWNGNAWSKVKPFKTGENRNLYRVKFSDGSYLDATSNHRFIVIENKKEIIYTTKELIEKLKTSKYNIRIPRSNIEYHEGGKYVDRAYQYGFILGDGCAATDGSYYRTPFAYIHHTETDMGHRFDESVTWGKGGNVYFTGVDKKLCYHMKYDHGLPDELFTWNRESIKEFIAGWIDSDGIKTKNGFRIYGREDKIRDGQLLLSKIGVNSSVNLSHKAGDDSTIAKRLNDVWYLQVADVKDLTCEKFNIQSKEVKAKDKFQNVKSIELLDGKHDSFCFEEPEMHQGVFANVLTKQCNLSELNGSKATSAQEFYKACRAAAIICTLQAGYTDFKFLPPISKKIFDREALIGVSVTGWMNNPDVLFDEEVLKKGASIIREVNRRVASLIGINPAARTTCVKPSGNASVLLGTASGIHGEHSPMYIRHMQMTKDSEIAQLIKRTNPYMVEDSVWSANRTDYNIAFPIVAKEGSIFKKDLMGIDLLEKVKLVQQTWIEAGTDVDLCVDPTIRHNVSNTVQVADDQWDDVEEYVYQNRAYFAGISFLSASGDKDYNQAPNTEVLTEDQIIAKYGRGAMFASGLIVDVLNGFNNLWDACAVARYGDSDDDQEKKDIRAEWIRRFHKYATNYFDGDMKKAEYCLKDVTLLHKWTKIQQNLKPIDFANNLEVEAITDIDTMGAIACAGGACEI